MSINLTLSLTDGGDPLGSELVHSNTPAGQDSTIVEIFLSHDGDLPLTDCGFYVSPLSFDDYEGSDNPRTDMEEILSWGDASAADSFGGLQLNMNATGAYPTWSTVGTKADTAYNVFRTGVGDSAANKILFPVAMGLTGSEGTLQAGAAPNVRFQCRFSAPTDLDKPSIKEINQIIRFNYTS